MRRQPKQFAQDGAATAQRWQFDGTLWVPFGEYAYTETEGSFVVDWFDGWTQVLRLTTPSLPAGDYIIGYQCALRVTGTNMYADVRVQVDDDPDAADHVLPARRWAAQDVSTNQRIPVHGFRRMTLGAGVHNIDMDIEAEFGEDVVVYNRRIYIRDAEDAGVGAAAVADNKIRLAQMSATGVNPNQQVWWDGSKWVVAGYFKSNESLSRTTNDNSWLQKLRLTTDSWMPAGKYLIGWHWSWDRDSESGDAGFRVQLDDTTDLQTWEIEPQDPSANQTNVISGFREQNLTAGVHTIDVDWQEVTNDNKVGIKDCYLDIEQVGF